MPRMQWPLRHGRPGVEVHLVVTATGKLFPRMRLADTGAGSRNVAFQLVLDESDCVLCGGRPLTPQTPLSGAYAGMYTMYMLPARLPALGFAQILSVVGVPTPPPNFDGIAGFGFLNRFTYGNFGDPQQFGLES
jgi:hypothetical protein